jgi:archaeosine-15-forming tRNA-guanine transglycosylase
MGTITSVGVDRFEIKKPDGTTQTVMVNDQTQFRERQAGQQQPQQLALEDLKVGDHVMVRGTPNADKQVVAVGVNRVTAEQFQRFQSGGGPGGGQGGPGGGGGGFGGRGGGGGMGPGAGGPRVGGEIVSISGNQIKVQSRRGGDRVIVVNDQTTFNKEGKTITLKDLKVGDRIFATGQEANGQFVATEVRSGRPGGGQGGRPQN